MKLFITWICLLLLSEVGKGLEWYEEGNPVFLTEANMEPALLDKSSIKVVKFFAPFCGYCRYLKNFVDEFKRNNQIHPNLKFYEMNCQETRLCSSQFGVRSYPVMVIFDENMNSLAQFNGLYPRNIIHNTLSEYNVKAKELGERLEKEKNVSPPIEQNKNPPPPAQNAEKIEDQKVEATLNMEQKAEVLQQQKQEKESVPQIVNTAEKGNDESAKIENIEKIDQSIKEQQQVFQNLNPSKPNEGNAEELESMKYILYGIGAIVVIAYAWHVHKTGVKGEGHENCQHDRMEQNIKNEETQPLSH